MLLTLCATYLVVLIIHSALKHGLRVYRNAVAEDVLKSSPRASGSTGYRTRGRTMVGSCAEGKRIAVLGQEVEAISVFAGTAFAEVAVHGGTIIGLSLFMILTQPLLASICLRFLLPQVLLVPFIQRRINVLSQERVGARRTLNTSVMDADTDNFLSTSVSLRGLGVNIAWWKSIARVLVNGLNALAPLTVLRLGGLLVIHGLTTLGVIVAFVSGFQRLADPARDLLDYYREASLTETRYRMAADRLCSVPSSR